MRWLSLTPELRTHVEHYAESHHTPANKLLHFLGIPLLTIAIMGLLSKLSFSSEVTIAALSPNAAWIALAVSAIWYVGLGWRAFSPG
jgi:uncharacterized membrane protein YGL010W